MDFTEDRSELTLNGGNAAPSFIMCTCQAGAESALKDEFLRNYPDLKFAYSRPGFVTFKSFINVSAVGASSIKPLDLKQLAMMAQNSIFARSLSKSLGKLQGSSPFEFAQDCARKAQDFGVKTVLLSPRDECELNPSDLEMFSNRLIEICSKKELATEQPVFEVVVVGDREWWCGLRWYSRQDRFYPWVYAGGKMELELPAEAPSRAYLKMKEGLLWSKLDVLKNDRAVEFGCSPGGASYFLLENGLTVIGVDPGDVANSVIKQEKFKHLRKQALQVDLESLQGVNWFFSDMNIPPDQAIEVLKKFSKIPTLKGGLITLKLKNWKQASEAKKWEQEIKSFGFTSVKFVHLYNNRSELCGKFRK